MLPSMCCIMNMTWCKNFQQQLVKLACDSVDLAFRPVGRSNVPVDMRYPGTWVCSSPRIVELVSFDSSLGVLACPSQYTGFDVYGAGI